MNFFATNAKYIIRQKVHKEVKTQHNKLNKTIKRRGEGWVAVKPQASISSPQCNGAPMEEVLDRDGEGCLIEMERV